MTRYLREFIYALLFKWLDQSGMSLFKKAKKA